MFVEPAVFSGNTSSTGLFGGGVSSPAKSEASSHGPSFAGTSATSVTSSFASRDAVLHVSTGKGRKVYRVSGSTFDVPQRYHLVDVLGHGSYGIVVSALDERMNSAPVAIKRVGRVFDDLVDGRRILREIQVLRILSEKNCRNIMRLYGLIPAKDPITTYREVYMVIEVCDTDLYYASRKIKPFSLTSFKKLAIQILHSIADMHAVGVIHRDMKPSNVLLVGEEEDVRICDFGLARGGMHIFSQKDDPKLTDYVVTRWYRAPELLLMQPYHYPVDLWSIGCVLVEYLVHIPLFSGKDYLDQLRLVVSTIDVDLDNLGFIENRSCLSFVKEFVGIHRGKKPLQNILPSKAVQCEHLVSFLNALMEFDPRRRPTANEILRHPLFLPEDGAKPSELGPNDDVDWSFDHMADFTEARLRRKIWDEVQLNKVV